MTNKTRKTLAPVGSIIRLKASAHRYRSGEALSCATNAAKDVPPRWKIVSFEGREFFVVRDEAEY